MTEQLLTILQFMADAFLKLWPYLLVTIPIAVAVNLSGASRHINRVFQARPLVAIFLAAAVGAFSPFCSCSVIPVVASLLIGGVPLAPVMTFWIASPSMDPETFFLSVAMLGWPLAVWRLAATLVLSLAAGFVTHLLVEQGWLGASILRADHAGGTGNTEVRGTVELLADGWRRLRQRLVPSPAGQGVASAAGVVSMDSIGVSPAGGGGGGSGCGGGEGAACSLQPPSFRRRLLKETWAATAMVAKFMALAFFLEALITLYVPEAWIAGLLGRNNPLAIVTAALLGVPVYTSNLTALPMIGGLLSQGMAPAAALAFLVAGPTTTLPAMAAVRGLVRRRVFVLYVVLSLLGAVAAGYAFQVIGALS
ncbi:MAG: permease [Candidatus Promineifilaceae bacterium]|nr:permease [Candidatus Promineifilaceae bacterium]